VGALSDSEPLIREHAAWALGRIGSDEALAALRESLLSETNPQVLAEISSAVSN
jgi:epoxyqueuosine reductase